jgi:hypothetical protein
VRRVRLPLAWMGRGPAEVWRRAYTRGGVYGVAKLVKAVDAELEHGLELYSAEMPCARSYFCGAPGCAL